MAVCCLVEKASGILYVWPWVKSVFKDEAIKLETSNRILKKKIKVIESQMKQLLLRSKISEEERQ